MINEYNESYQVVLEGSKSKFHINIHNSLKDVSDLNSVAPELKECNIIPKYIDKYFYICAYDGNQLIGCITYMVTDWNIYESPKSVTLKWVYIKPKYRELGLVRILLIEALDNIERDFTSLKNVFVLPAGNLRLIGLLLAFDFYQYNGTQLLSRRYL